MIRNRRPIGKLSDATGTVNETIFIKKPSNGLTPVYVLRSGVPSAKMPSEMHCFIEANAPFQMNTLHRLTHATINSNKKELAR